MQNPMLYIYATALPCGVALHYFFFFFNSVLHPFQDYFSTYETGQSVGERKWENTEKNHLAHPQAELGLSHVARAQLEPTPDTAVKRSSEKNIS